MSGIQRSVFPFGPTITDAYNISTNGTGAFGDNSNNLLTNFTPSNDSAQLGVKGNINGVGTYFSNSVTSIRLPADSSANRPPQGLTGYIRYNTDLSQNNIEYYNGFVPAWQQLMTTTYYQSVVSASPPTQKSYTSVLTTTYTPTSSSVLYIKIRMVGGGGEVGEVLGHPLSPVPPLLLEREQLLDLLRLPPLPLLLLLPSLCLLLEDIGRIGLLTEESHRRGFTREPVPVGRHVHRMVCLSARFFIRGAEEVARGSSRRGGKG